MGLYEVNWGWRWEGVDTALEHHIFITLRIGSNDEDSQNNVKSLVILRRFSKMAEGR